MKLVSFESALDTLDWESLKARWRPETENQNILRFRYYTQRLKRKYCEV